MTCTERWKKMNLANKLTVSRVVMIPVFLVVILCDFFEPDTARLIGVAIFIIASITDFLDGYIARSRNLVTNFGKFMDPLADKLLVAAALISMVELGDVSAWVVIVIISREFIITGFRLIAVEANVVIAASNWGKLKTVSQMVMIIVVLSGILGNSIICDVLIYLSTVLTVVSGVDYVAKNLKVLR